MTRVAAMARLWSRLPSEILHITDDYTAYCLDEAVMFFVLSKQVEGQESQEKISPDVVSGLMGAADLLECICERGGVLLE